MVDPALLNDWIVVLVCSNKGIYKEILRIKYVELLKVIKDLIHQECILSQPNYESDFFYGVASLGIFLNIFLLFYKLALQM